jgi:hypothetical protein
MRLTVIDLDDDRRWSRRPFGAWRCQTHLRGGTAARRGAQIPLRQRHARKRSDKKDECDSHEHKVSRHDEVWERRLRTVMGLRRSDYLRAAQSQRAPPPRAFAFFDKPPCPRSSDA